MSDRTERTVTYQSHNADRGQEWAAQFWYGKTRLHMLFFGSSESEVVEKANAFWDKERQQREANWEKKEAAKAKREATA